LLEATVAELKVGATLLVSRVDRGGISATKLDVLVNGEKDLPREEFWAAQKQKAGSGAQPGAGDRRPAEPSAHSHSHSHEHGHSHSHSHDAGHSHSHSPQ